VAPRQRYEVYRLAVICGAAVLFVAGLPRLIAGRPVEWGLVAFLLVAGVLAQQFLLQISLSQRVSVDSAVFFAALLVLPAWQTAAVVAVTQAIGVVIGTWRRMRAIREKPPRGEVAMMLLFNSAQLYIATLAAALLLAWAGVSARGSLSSAAIAAAVGAAVILYTLNVGLVSTGVAFATRRRPMAIFINTHHVVGVQLAGLYLLGGVAAFAAVRIPWMVALALVPAALAYTSMRRRIQLTRETVRAVEKMAEEVDARDPYTFEHSLRVATYSKAIGQALGLSSPELELVELSAKVHDIGKIRIPDSILLKPGRLTDQERRVMETHPRLGFEILSQFSAYEKVLELVLTHHERYDGRGYPNSTVGRRLLLVAQVIPVADSLDAMTTTRAYRGAKSWDAAMAELRRGAGAQWNPKVVEAAVAALAGVPSAEVQAPIHQSPAVA
jgi:putative nucleotidyltransferase with HDIG domain